MRGSGRKKVEWKARADWTLGSQYYCIKDSWGSAKEQEREERGYLRGLDVKEEVAGSGGVGALGVLGGEGVGGAEVGEGGGLKGELHGVSDPKQKNVRENVWRELCERGVREGDKKGDGLNGTMKVM